MKAFVVVALLVASAASLDMDFMRLNKEKSLLKHSRPLSGLEDLLLKEKLGSHWTNTWNTEYPTWGQHKVTVLSMEEIMTTSLFREYLNIPLFRQFWEEHPVVFRRYIESVLFQQFWTVPEFKQYFRNPVLFYKYIVPQVQIISHKLKSEGIYNFNKFETLDSVEDKWNYPYTHQSEYQRYPYNKEWSVPMSRGIEGLDFPSTYNHGVNYKYILEKIAKHLNMNKYNMGQEVTETLTDVKMLPSGIVKEQTVGKMVNPITGEEKVTVGDIKLVDEKIVPVHNMDFPVENKMNKIYETEMMKDAILKRIYLNKIFGKKMMTPEYETIYGNKHFMTPEFETVFGKKMMTPEYETIFDKKVMTPEFETVFGKKMFTPEYETTYGKKVMTPEFYETIMNKGIYEPTMMNEWESNKYMSPLVSRMYGLKNKNTFNKMDWMTMKNTFETKKMLEEFQKEKFMNKLRHEMIKNEVPYMTKEHNILYNIDNELPTMMETEMPTEYRHIPLTFGKSLGSGIEEFKKEHEIKY